MKYCTNCFGKKKKEEFGKDKQKRDGLSQYCKPCIRIRSSEQRKNYPVYFKNYADKYRKENRAVLRVKSRIRLSENREKYYEMSNKSYYKYRHEIAIRRAIRRRSIENVIKNRERSAEWRKRTGKAVAYVTRWRRDNPEKAAVHSLILWAVRTNILKRNESCEECGVNCKTQGHHEDYSKPLEVIWLCSLCHGKKHRIYR